MLAQPANLPPFGGGAFGELLERCIAASPRQLMMMTIPASAFWLAYLTWAGLWVAVAVATLGLARQIAGAMLPDRAMQAVSLVALGILALLFFDDDWVMLLPILGAGCKTMAAWLRDNPVSFRMALVAAEICHVVFGSMVGAQVLVMASIGLLLLNISAIRHLHCSDEARRLQAPA